MIQDSIFTESPRFEQESRHYYYLYDKWLGQLEANTPLIVYGSRGTGKTTLLNALNWKEQSTNASLSRKFATERYKTDYLGVYVRLSAVNFESLNHWYLEDSKLYAQVFSFFIDLVWLEQIVTALGELAADQSLEITASEELAICKSVVEKFRFLGNISERHTSPRGFNDLAHALSCARKYVEQSAQYRESVLSVHKRFEITGQVGDFGRQVSRSLHEAWAIKNKTDYKFKVCWDECEVLEDFQVRILSTVVRLSGHPVYFVYAFVSFPSNFDETLLNRLTNSRADVSYIALDDMNDHDFVNFAQGVVNVRLEAIEPGSDARFSMSDIFGELSINELLEKILKRSEKSNAQDFLLEAESQRLHPYFQYYKGESMPLYQVYLVKSLELDIDDELQSPTSTERKSQESKEIRKKMVAAYLSICADFDATPIYASSDMIFQISDNCIRDYLHFLHEVFMEFGRPLREFLLSRVPIEIQDKALKRASANKLRTIPSNKLSEPGKTFRVVSCLGRLTELLQSRSGNLSHLKSSERGLFMLTSSELDSEQRLVNLITESAEAGYFKITSSKNNELRFRVHTSLAPHFRFSYRGAYYETPISYEQLQSFCDAIDEAGIERNVRLVSKSLEREADNQMYFDGM